ncbi:hypothetical protein [Variovorax sp. RT4R15]|uniref:hypothetical protein n=1 Tax=Variovorax sp. RT4R15 TaxID=3443737 RepID=UPI003F49415E
MEAIADDRVIGFGATLASLEQRMVMRDLSSDGSSISAVTQRLVALEQVVSEQVEQLRNVRRSTFKPDPSLNPASESSPFMPASNCQASDFYHPRFAQLCKLMAQRPHFHRKQWEWVYVLHHLEQAGVLSKGSRGLGFGVGTEPLPAVFASMGVDVVATDAPLDASRAADWHSTHQHSGDVSQLLNPHIAPDDLVRAKVAHRQCDMNDIDPSLRNFDFNWSCCCFEHLGSLEHGLRFVVNAVENTLRIGGVAVHTTEFNASSNEATVAEGSTVIYRLRDMGELVERLRDRGHDVQPFIIGPTEHALDYHVDVPPYVQDVHLKMLLASYVTTSVGLVVRRGR